MIHETFYRKLNKEYIVYHRKCGSNKVIAFVGDSFTMGDGVVEQFSSDEAHIYANNHNYSHYFSAYVGDVDIINVGIGGASNETILDSLCVISDELSKYEHVLVMYGITCSARTQLVLDNQRIMELGLSHISRTALQVHDDIDWEWYKKYREAYHVVGTSDAQCNRKFGRTLVGFQDHCKLNNYDWLIFPIWTVEPLTGLFADETCRSLFVNHLDESKIIMNFGMGGGSATEVAEEIAHAIYGDNEYYRGVSGHHINSEGYRLVAEMIYDHFRTMGYEKWSMKNRV